LLNGRKPVAVWTGSTNISAGGIFGHSNVGHVVWDEGVARKYLDYWQRLAANLTPNKLRRPNKAAAPTPRGKPPKNSVFCARRRGKQRDTPVVCRPARRSQTGRLHDLRLQHRHRVPASLERG
jgi:hypothetical protein